ncbi:uncharacterized protein LOC109859820 isoform X1 [Pseudomyrmex gracilis]|uniref:uncharacterized protein LOC109859820 isoform X1 n=1 Tax=Pseudomyrmex gracilis TaxID=219809 RepID=UPI000995B08D|nr:uncharacterized protein LOC109859820 isoform X1 [Pseudomyrmex gracilis]XP_020294000.1 uncharacterized protein LOC109859820 isoform X1 [Pseudomyrmex gracilis]XP_020294001.1 uncharacterized protein LOC109859820 isoform X1 [Pseudomyrmex gracilis]
MREFLDILPKIWAKKRTLNTASDEKEKSDDSKNISARLHVSKKYLKLLNSVRNIKLQCEKDIRTKKTISDKTRKELTATEVKICSMFTDIRKLKNLKDTYCDSILSVAITVLVNIYMSDIRNEINKVEECCKMNIELMKGQELSPKYIILAMATQLWRNYILYLKNAPKKERYSCLSTAMLLHCTYTAKEIYPTPIKYDEIYYGHETNPKLILDQFQINILEEIIKMYIFYPHDKHEFVLYMHKLLKDTMEEALLQSGHLEWSSTCSNLVFYFISHNRFCEAKSHLLIANKIMNKYIEKIMIIAETDNTSDEEKDVAVCRYYNAIHAHNLRWVQYATELIRSSQERLLQGEKISNNNSPCEIDNSSLTASLVFDETSEPVLAYYEEGIIDYRSFTDQYLIHYDDVRKLCEPAMEIATNAMNYFDLTDNLYRLGETGLYLSRLYKYLSYSVRNSSMAIEWHNKRVKNLKYISDKLKTCTVLQEKRLYQAVCLELGLAYCASLDKMEEKIVRTGEDLRKDVTNLFREQVRNIIDCFNIVKLYDSEFKTLSET